MKRFKVVKLLSALLAVGIWMGAVCAAEPSADGSATGQAAFEGAVCSADGTQTFTLAAQVGQRALYVDAQTGQFFVADRVSGVRWYSVPENLGDVKGMKGSAKTRARSLLMLDIRNAEDNSGGLTATSHGDSVNTGGVRIHRVKNGVCIEYTFPDYSLTVPLTLELTEEGFCAFVEADKIREEDVYQIVSMDVLPYFNAGYCEEDGFMLVPDGSGAVIGFDNGKGKLAAYEQTVYGRDYAIALTFDSTVEQEVRLPVYGVAHEKQYSLSIITKGAASASVMAAVNTSTNHYNYVHSGFLLRTCDYFVNEGQWSDVATYPEYDLPARTLEVTYLLREGEDATYMDMALTCREYLQKHGGLPAESVASVASAGAVELNLLGATVKKKLVLGFPVNRLEEITSFAEAQALLDTLHEEAVEGVTVRYRKWSSATAWGKSKASASGLSVLGGKKQYNALLQSAEEHGYALYLEADPVRVYKGRSLFSFFTDYAQSVFNSTVKLYGYKPHTYAEDTDSRVSYLIKTASLTKQLEQWTAKISSLSATGVSLAGTGTLYTDFRKEDANREDTLNAIVSGLESKGENSLAIVGGNAYTLPYAAYLSNVPGSASGYDIEDDSVPFYQAVVHGLIPYSTEAINAQSNSRSAFLRAVEVGAVLQFELAAADMEELQDSEDSGLYYADAEAWLPEIVKMAKRYQPVYQQVKNQRMTSHACLAEGVYATAYADGSVTVVNYTDETVDTVYGAVESQDFVAVLSGKE